MALEAADLRASSATTCTIVVHYCAPAHRGVSVWQVEESARANSWKGRRAIEREEEDAWRPFPTRSRTHVCSNVERMV